METATAIKEVGIFLIAAGTLATIAFLGVFIWFFKSMFKNF